MICAVAAGRSDIGGTLSGPHRESQPQIAVKDMAATVAAAVEISGPGQYLAALREKVPIAATSSEVFRLQSNAASIRIHEAAHQRAGGGYAGGASYLYQVGPDGQAYISGGEVSIAVPMGATPQETLNSMRRIKQAALAPADPSAQDLRVALQAAAVMNRMEAQIQEQENGGVSGGGSFPHSIQELIIGQVAMVASWTYAGAEGIAAYRQQAAMVQGLDGMDYQQWVV